MREMKLALGVLLVIVGLWIILSATHTTIPPVFPITTFEQCVAAGNPILETFPEQCKTPDGKTFVRAISEACQSDATCESGYFCKYGLCTEFSVQTSCDTDNDCMLIDRTKRFACCYAGQCDAIDYSNQKWIAVNVQWFEKAKHSIAPAHKNADLLPGALPRS